MTRRDISLTLALCASLTVHALMLASAAELYIRQVGMHPWLPGFTRAPEASSLVMAAPVPNLPEEEDPLDRIGDSTGKGTAIGSAPGDLPLMAPKASQDQPFLSLDPSGPGRIGDAPTDSLMPLGRAGAPTPPPAAQSPQAPVPLVDMQSPPAAVEAAPLALGFGAPANDLANPFAPPPPKEVAAAAIEQQPQPEPETPAESIKQTPSPQETVALAEKLPPAAPSPPVEQPSAMPGAAESADPAPQGSTESDPTSTIGSVQFRAGSTDVRLGRKFKLTRPQLSIAGRTDLMTRARPVVVLKISIDETGKVTSASVYRSSGSIHVDQPCQLAAYDWWFEPLKDKNGKPQKDVILFAISFIG